MLDIRQVVAVVLFLVKGLWEIIQDRGDFLEFEERVYRLTQEAAAMLLVWSLEKADKRILQTRDRKWECVRLEERTGIASFGEFRIKRRLYRHRETGEYCFLLDQALGWEAGERLTPRMRKLAVELGVEMPFRRAAKLLGMLVPGVSAMSIWQVTKRAGEAAQEEGSKLREAVFERGEVPEGKREVETLCIEADGVFVRQQRSKRQKEEVRLITAYEGKQVRKGNRRELQNRYSVATTQEGEAFWEEVDAKLSTRWQIERVKKIEVGGDGAPWPKQGLEIFPHATYHLDKFHLRKSLTEGLAHSRYYESIVESLNNKDREGLVAALQEAMKASQGSQRKRVQKLQEYLLDNWEGIIAELPAGGLGTIEGQVRHTIARRMKRNGARWSPGGTDRMARLLSAHANKELDRYLPKSRPMDRATLKLAVGQEPISGSKHYTAEDTGAWLRAHLPALDTSYPVAYLLRRVMEALPMAI